MLPRGIGAWRGMASKHGLKAWHVMLLCPTWVARAMHAMHAVLPVTLPDVPCEVDNNPPVAQTKAAGVFGSVFHLDPFVFWILYRSPSLPSSLKTGKNNAVRRGQMSAARRQPSMEVQTGDGTGTPYSEQYQSRRSQKYK